MADAKWWNGAPGEVSGDDRRETGPRREPPAVCYYCGDDVPLGERFGLEACCDRDACRWKAVERRR